MNPIQSNPSTTTTSTSSTPSSTSSTSYPTHHRTSNTNTRTSSTQPHHTSTPTPSTSSIHPKDPAHASKSNQPSHRSKPSNNPIPKLRRASSKVFAHVQHPFSSSGPSPSISPPILVDQPQTVSLHSKTPSSTNSQPQPDRSRRDSMNSSDYDPISTADARSFEDDGQEGSLQDALDTDHLTSSTDGHQSQIPLTATSQASLQPQDTPRSKPRFPKLPKPGKQHGATSFPATPITSHQRHLSASPNPSPQTSLPVERSQSSPNISDDQAISSPSQSFSNSPSPSLPRRPKTATSPFRTNRESALSIVAGGHAALPSRLSGWFQHAFSSSNSHLPILTTTTPALIGSPERNKQEKPIKKKVNAKDLCLESDHTPGRRPPSVDPKRSPGASSHHVAFHTRGLGNFFDKAVNYMFDTDAHVYDSRLSSELWMMGGQHFPGLWKWDEPKDDALLDDHSGSVVGGAIGSGSDASHQNHPKKRSALRRVTINKGKGFFRHSNTSSHTTHHLLPSSSDPPRESIDPISSRRSMGVTFSPSASPSPEPSFHAHLHPSPSEHTSLLTLTSMVTHSYPPPFYHAFASVIGLTYRSDFPPIPCAPDRLRGTGLSAAGTRMGGMLASLSLSIGRGGKKTKSNHGDSRSPSPNMMRGDRTDEDETGDVCVVKGLTTDAGWGCMLRTGQSLLANAILVAHLGREWRRPIGSIADPSSSLSPDPVYARIVSWFVDSSSPLAPFSVHRFASKGKELGKEVGEWFGPSTAAGAIKALTNEFHAAGLGVASDIDGTVYRSDVFQSSINPTFSNGMGQRSRPGSKKPAWQRPVLVLINVRLGLDRVNPSYHETIKATFTFPQSVGIAGGRPSSSYYFCGYQGDSLFYIDPHHTRQAIPLEEPPGSLVLPAQRLGLSHRPSSTSLKPTDGDWEQLCGTDSDSVISGSGSSAPSSSRPKTAPIPKQPWISSGEASSLNSSRDKLDEFFVRAYPDSALKTFHPEKVRRMSLSAMDPSMLAGFLVRDEADWEDLATRIRSFKPPLFHIADVMPAWLRPSPKQTHRGSVDFRPSDDSDLGVDSWSEPDDWEGNGRADDMDDSSFDSHTPSIEVAEPVDDSEAGPVPTIQNAMSDDEEWDDADAVVKVPARPVATDPTALHTRSDTLRAARLQESLAISQELAPTPTTTTKKKAPILLQRAISLNKASSSHQPHQRSPLSRLSSDHIPDEGSSIRRQNRSNHKVSRSLSISLSGLPCPSPASPNPPRSRNVSAATLRARPSDEHLADSEETLNHGQRRRLDSQGSLRALVA